MKIERDQPQVARGQHAADAEAVADQSPQPPPRSTGSAAKTTETAPPHGLELAPRPMLAAVHAIMRGTEMVVSEM